MKFNILKSFDKSYESLGYNYNIKDLKSYEKNHINNTTTIFEYYQYLINENGLKDIIYPSDTKKMFSPSEVFQSLEKYNEDFSRLKWNNTIDVNIMIMGLIRKDFENYIQSTDFIDYLVTELNDR